MLALNDEEGEKIFCHMPGAPHTLGPTTSRALVHLGPLPNQGPLHTEPYSDQGP